MSWALTLVVPADEEDEQLLRAYCEHVAEREAQWLGEPRYDSPESYPAYTVGVESLEAGRDPVLVESISRHVATVDATDAIRAIFDEYGTDDSTPELTGREPLDELVETLREAARRLDASADVTDANWVGTFETQPIALVTFARDHDYGVELSF